MTGNQVHFWDGEIWSFVVTLGIIFIAMLAANMLRRLIGPLRRSLIPSSVLAGFLLLIANAIYKQAAGHSMFGIVTLEALTYHGLGLGVVALSFRTAEKRSNKHTQTDILNTGLTTVSTYLLQGILGMLISIGCFYALGSFWASGMLLPMGYGQGPGQAFNWGFNYQNEYGFANGTSFGLTVAAAGFIAASIGGIIYMNVMKRKGQLKAQGVNAEEVEDLSAEMVTQKGEIPLSESLDKLTVQVGLVLFAYMAAYVFMHYVSALLDSTGAGLADTVKALMWGFNFLVGMLFAFIIKLVMRFFKKVGVRKREYTNNFMLNRISGLLFDIMVVASIAAIDLSAFKIKEFLIPLILMCVLGAFASYYFIRFISRKLFPTYTHEAFLSMYGMLSGTVSTGLILMREIDPLYETPASGNLIFQNLWAVVFGFPMLLLLGFAPQSIGWGWLSVGLMAVFFIGITTLLFRSYLFKSKKGGKKQAK
ncbi:MAG: hypothetical protein WDA00_03350 [Eubacteriales bacterium]